MHGTTVDRYICLGIPHQHMAVTKQKQLFVGLPLYCQRLQGCLKKCDKHSIKFLKKTETRNI